MLTFPKIRRPWFPILYIIYNIYTYTRLRARSFVLIECVLSNFFRKNLIFACGCARDILGIFPIPIPYIYYTICHGARGLLRRDTSVLLYILIILRGAVAEGSSVGAQCWGQCWWGLYWFSWPVLSWVWLRCLFTIKLLRVGFRTRGLVRFYSSVVVPTLRVGLGCAVVRRYASHTSQTRVRFFCSFGFPYII